MLTVHISFFLFFYFLNSLILRKYRQPGGCGFGQNIFKLAGFWARSEMLNTVMVPLPSSTGSARLRLSGLPPRELVFHSLMTSKSSLSEPSELCFFFPLPRAFFLGGGRRAERGEMFHLCVQHTRTVATHSHIISHMMEEFHNHVPV